VWTDIIFLTKKFEVHFGCCVDGSGRRKEWGRSFTKLGITWSRTLAPRLRSCRAICPCLDPQKADALQPPPSFQPCAPSDKGNEARPKISLFCRVNYWRLEHVLLNWFKVECIYVWKLAMHQADRLLWFRWYVAWKLFLSEYIYIYIYF
jgi:hypothetical protein